MLSVVERASVMEFRGWLSFGFVSVLVAIYLWATKCEVNGAPAPLPVSKKLPRLTEQMVLGPYAVAPHSCSNFTFVLLPGNLYRAHFASFYNNSPNQDWSGTWKLDADRSMLFVQEWPDGIDWYGTEYQAARWYINLRRDRLGRIIRENYILHYWHDGPKGNVVH